MVFFSLALCVSQMDAAGQKRRMAALKGSAPWWESSLDGQERARGGLVAHFTHTVIPPRGKSPFCLKGAGKRSCVRMERGVVSAPSRQRSWVKPQKSFHFLWKKKKKSNIIFIFFLRFWTLRYITYWMHTPFGFSFQTRGQDSFLYMPINRDFHAIVTGADTSKYIVCVKLAGGWRATCHVYWGNSRALKALNWAVIRHRRKHKWRKCSLKRAKARRKSKSHLQFHPKSTQSRVFPPWQGAIWTTNFLNYCLGTSQLLCCYLVDLHPVLCPSLQTVLVHPMDSARAQLVCCLRPSPQQKSEFLAVLLFWRQYTTQKSLGKILLPLI